MYYRRCTNCGAYLDPGEKCDCMDRPQITEPRPAQYIETEPAEEDHPSSYIKNLNLLLQSDDIICPICGKEINKRVKAPDQRRPDLMYKVAPVQPYHPDNSPDNLQLVHRFCLLAKINGIIKDRTAP